jgi:hypothetical protein
MKSAEPKSSRAILHLPEDASEEEVERTYEREGGAYMENTTLWLR